MRLERLLPERYLQAREMREANKAMRNGTIPPKVNFYDLTNKSDEKKLATALKVAQGKRILVPWSTFSDRSKRLAQQYGSLIDRYDLFSRDILELDKPKGFWDGREVELTEELRLRDNPDKFLIVHYPWQNYFIKTPRHKDFKLISQSRETGITSEQAQKALDKDKITILGGGVGGWNALSLVRAGAEHIILVDGSELKPHRGNRTQGPFIPGIGENQATYHIKQALEVNPFGDYRAIPRFAGDPKVNPGCESIVDLVANSDFIFDEMDDLVQKGRLHLLARKMNKPIGQITDAATGTIVTLDDPNFVQWPFDGRLTPEVFEEITCANLKDTETFMHYAVNIFMGKKNITPEFEAAFRLSREKSYHHIPQSGRAASKAGSEAVKLYCDYVEGKIVHPLERIIE